MCDRAQAVTIADGLSLKDGVVGAAATGFVDGGRERALLAFPRAVDAVKRVVEGLDILAEELSGVELLALGRDGLA